MKKSLSMKRIGRLIIVAKKNMCEHEPALNAKHLYGIPVWYPGSLLLSHATLIEAARRSDEKDSKC